MSTKKRKQYVRKSSKRAAKKPKKSFWKPVIAVVGILVLALIVWQAVIRISEKEEGKPSIAIEEKEPSPPAVHAESKVDSVISYALNRLEVPQNFITTTKKNDEIHKDIILNSGQLTLTIANIFITDKVKEAGGKIINVEENSSGTAIQMRIFDPDIKKYFILNIRTDEQGLYKEITNLSIIIDDFGSFGGELLDEFLALDKSITFSILPDLPYSREVMHKAYEQGREVLIHIPMEPITYPKDDPGKNAIFVDLSDKEIEKRVKSYIKELPLAIGANNHMGSMVMQYRRPLETVMQVLKENDMFFVDSHTTSKTVGWEVAREMDVPSYLVDFFLDAEDVSQRGFAERMAEKILQYAKTHTEIVVITHCKSSSLNSLTEILENLKNTSIKLVPLSEIVLPKEYVL
jgi:hypothetical protein